MSASHKGYSRPSPVADIAVLSIVEESDIPLPIVSRDLGQLKTSGSASAMGWGTTSLKGRFLPDELKIARGLETTPGLCLDGNISVICANSKTGQIASGNHLNRGRSENTIVI